MKMTKKLIAMLEAIVLILGVLPAMVYAAAPVANQDEFVTACANAANGDTIVLGNGEFAIGPVDINGKTLTFRGQGAANTKVYIGNGGYDGNGGHGSSKTANMRFEDLTLDDLTSDSGYLTGFTQAAGLTFKNVTFDVGFSNWGNKGGDVVFTNCIFNQTNTGKYNVQELRSANGTKFTFDGCTFNSKGGRFINAYKQGGASASISVTVKNCSFNGDISDKAALNLKTNLSDGCCIVLYLLGTNTTTNVKAGKQTGESLYDDNGTHGTVYMGYGMGENEKAVVWENGAKTGNVVPTRPEPNSNIPNNLPAGFTTSTDNTSAPAGVADIAVSGISPQAKNALSGVLTADEITAVNSGVPIDIVLEVKSTDVPAGDIATISTKASDMGLNITGYKDIKIAVQVNSGAKHYVSEPGTITVSMQLDANLNPPAGINRTYYVIGVHNGQTVIAPAFLNPVTGVLTCSLSKFSTYAVCYTDTEAGKTTPKTGVADTLPIWFAVFALSAAVMYLTDKKRFHV